MPYFTIGEARAAARQESLQARKSISVLLREAASSRGPFDIFLSHSIRDDELVEGTKRLLQDHGYTVYVDWLDDPELDRTHVTPSTAKRLRERMRQCRSLLYLYTVNSSVSLWMQWELGFFDGFHGSVGVLPVLEDANAQFAGTEFVGLYPIVDRASGANLGRKGLFVRPTGGYPIELRTWVK